MKNRHKIGGKSEKNRRGGQYCWVMHSGSRVDVQKKEISVVFDPKVRKKKIMMIIPIRIQPIGDWEGGHMTKF